MDETKKVLLSIDLDTDALTQNAKTAKDSVAALADQLKETKNAGKESGDALDKAAEQLKKAGEAAGKHSAALKENAKAMGDSAKASSDLADQHQKMAGLNNAASDGTAEYSKTLKEYGNDLLKAAENASPVIKSVADTADKVKSAREIVGQLSDAFTGYKDKLQAAHEGSKTFNTTAGEGAQAFSVLKTGTETAEGGVKSFTSALAETGIGLVIVALSALMDYLKQFTPLVEFTERVTAGLSGGFTALGRIVLDLISPLKKVFTDPKQAIIDLGKFILDNIINRFKAVGDIINSILHPSLKGLADGFIQLSTGVTNATDKIANFGKTIVKASADTAKLKGEQQELSRTVQEESLKAAETEAKIAELQTKTHTGSLAQRKAAAAEIAALRANQAKLHKDNIEKGADLAIKDVALKRGLTQQEIELIKSKGSAELDALQKQGRIYADDIKALSDSLIKKNELHKEYADKRDKQHTEGEAKHKERTGKRQHLETLDAAVSVHTTQNTVNAQKELVHDIDNFTITAAEKSGEQTTQIDENTVKAKKKLNAETLTDYQQHFSKLSGLFAKNTEAGKAAFMAKKAFAAAEIALNTEKQVSEIFTATRKAVSDDMDYGPIVGPIKAAIDIAIGAAEVVGTIANGVKQAATINSTNVQGFARGGMYQSDGLGAYLTGPGTGTSDSINARLSNGEAVINARSTEMFAPILSAINMAGGGRAFNSQASGNGYALGGLFNGSNTLNDTSNDLATTRATNDMVRTIAANMPRQVLVVEDVQASLQNKVMLQNMSNF